MMSKINPSKSERGFVLATSLVLLLLLTTLSIAAYYATVISQQTSATAQESTQAYYFAETGINYLSWALQNDAELDGYDPMTRYSTDNQGNRIPDGAGGWVMSLDPYASGDKKEWQANIGNPSRLQFIQDAFVDVYGTPIPNVSDIYGQLAYFDNRDVYARPVALIDRYTFADGYTGLPNFYDIYTQLSGYIILAIDQYGNITPTLSTVPHAPLGANFSGAIVWLTGGDPYTDRQLYPVDVYAAPLLDEYSALFNLKPVFGVQVLPITAACENSLASCAQPYIDTIVPLYEYRNRVIARNLTNKLPSYYWQLPCDLGTFDIYGGIAACDQGRGQWLTANDYNLVAYAIGYTRGRARKMIRMTLNF